MTVEEMATETPILFYSISVVGLLLAIMVVLSTLTSIYLLFKYLEYNHATNSLKMTGENIAKKVLSDNGLTDIKVECNGSILFGNSYSHFFKKIRLRRGIIRQTSVSSLAMATEKCSLALLDKEEDPDMKARIKITPIIYFGPVMFIPLITIGILLDMLVFNTGGILSAIISGLSFLLYLTSFLMSFLVLKTERKAQSRALEMCKEKGYANEHEINMMRDLFNLYNIEYINDMVIALLELILRVLELVVNLKFNITSSKN